MTDRTPSLRGIAYGDVRTRVARLRATLAEEHSAEAMLVSSAANIRYLTGFTGVSTGLLVLPDRLALIADGRYRTRALHTISAPHLAQDGAEVILPHLAATTIKQSLPGGAPLVIEADNVSMAEYKRLASELAGHELLPADDIVLQQRLIKDAGEIARISAAAAITDAALEELIAAEPLGWTELQAAEFIWQQMIAIGAERAAFEPIVATAERTALAHSRPSRARIEENTLVVMDFGAEIDGYKADLTRTLWWGELPRELEDRYEQVRQAYDAAVAALNPGTSREAVDAAARDVLAEHDLEQFVVHPCGHNLGLEIHERPFLGQGCHGELAAGNVVTVEPGIYIPDVGGIRLEDTFVLTDDGPAAVTAQRHMGGIDRRRGSATGPSAPIPSATQVPGPHVHWDEDDFSERSVDFEKLDDHKRFLLGDRAPWPPVDSEPHQGGQPPGGREER
jgi:Xaa-Pro aminopeptidase